MCTKEEIYTLLQEKMSSYAEIASIPIEPVEEAMVPISRTDTLLATQVETSMLAITGADLYVRKTVAAMLESASAKLAALDNSLQLDVVYGYRHPAIQNANFNKLKARFAAEQPGLSEEALHHQAVRFIADLAIAGHPTGSSVDVRVLSHGEIVDMGTKNREFVPDTYVFSPFISKQAWDNRQLLRQVMIGCGFAPYDGEWWHFSYGDREWAAYYNKPAAIYGPIEFEVPGLT